MYIAQSTIRALHKRIQANTEGTVVSVAGERLSHCKAGTNKAKAMMSRCQGDLVGVYGPGYPLEALVEDVEACGARVGRPKDNGSGHEQ